MNESETGLSRVDPERVNQPVVAGDQGAPSRQAGRFLKVFKGTVVGLAAIALVLCALGLFLGLFLLMAGLAVFGVAVLALLSLLAAGKWRLAVRRRRGIAMRLRFGKRARLR